MTSKHLDKLTAINRQSLCDFFPEFRAFSKVANALEDGYLCCMFWPNAQRLVPNLEKPNTLGAMRKSILRVFLPQRGCSHRHSSENVAEIGDSGSYGSILDSRSCWWNGMASQDDHFEEYQNAILWYWSKGKFCRERGFWECLQGK